MADWAAEIAIIGAGPAGAHLASRLAASGRDVTLLDPRGAWEKPCGGGVPTRALREFAFILESTDYPRQLIHRITLISHTDRRVTVRLKIPFAVYSRQVFNGLILDRATRAGAKFVRASITDFARQGDGWEITTSDGQRLQAKFLVGADGAASFTRRRLVGIFPAGDLALAFGYNVAMPEPMNGDRTEDEVIVRFPERFTGYLWAFPRPGVMNFGVASKLGERTSDELRRLLAGFVRDYYGGQMPGPERMSFFGAKIPTLEFASWTGLQTVGDRWALVGDAAGFADPITGEGIYYALKSADLLADAFQKQARDYGRIASDYERLWREAFGRDLEHASYRLPQFYHSHFFGHLFPDAVVLLSRYHKGVRTVLMRALIGEQSYATLKRDLLRRAWQFF